MSIQRISLIDKFKGLLLKLKAPPYKERFKKLDLKNDEMVVDNKITHTGQVILYT